MIKVYKVKFGSGMNSCIARDIQEVCDIISGLDVGDSIGIHIKEIDEKNYNALPEFTGP